MSAIRGTVYSATTIRVPGIAHAAEAPFVVLLVDTEDGRRVLGRSVGGRGPVIGTRVEVVESRDSVMLFAAVAKE